MALESDRRTREQLLALYEIGRAINSTLHLEAVLDRILEMTFSHFEAEAGSVMLLGPDQVLRIAAARGLSDDIVRTTAVRVGEGIAGWVAQTGQTLQLDGKVDDPRFVGVVERSDRITSSLCTPLRHRDQTTIGVLMIRRGGSTNFTADQLSFFASVSDLAAVAIENARLYRAEALERQKMQGILSSMADGVLVCRPEGTITHSNTSARRLFACPEALEGRSVAELIPALPLEQVVRRCMEGQGFERQLTVARPGSEDIVVRFLATPLGLEPERLEGVVCVLQDETERAQVERMKSEFLSMVSHELKTPITTIQAFLELLLYREFPAERQEHFHRICLDESVRLQKLIEAILDLSRLEAGQFAFHKVPSRIDQLIKAVLPGFCERCPDHPITFECQETVPELSLDPTLITQALTNLLSNAVKYSPAGGPITVKVQGESNRVVVSVTDQGIGIARDKLPFVFEKFFRADNSLTRSTGGTGLGLANTRYIVEGHGGSIWVDSELERGSQFSFALPVAHSP